MSPDSTSKASALLPGVTDLPYAYEKPDCSGLLRTCPEDFCVIEDLGFAPDGEGEHLLVQVKKRNANTAWVAGWLAKVAKLRERDIGFAGMKDRHAVTTQWFSVPLGAKAPVPDWPKHDDIEILGAERHSRKLRRGALAGNRFIVILRELTGDVAQLEARSAKIVAHGVPNYFGPQRFGRQGANIERAAMMFAGQRVKRQQRGIYLSAARSYLFNRVLAARVSAQNWYTLLPGEAVMLAGSRSFFSADAIDVELEQRLQAGDVGPSGPLWGRGESPAQAKAQQLESDVLKNHAAFMTGLEQAGLKHERRAFCLPVPNLELKWLNENTVQLCFSLPAGCFATSVLRELINYKDATHAEHNKT